jgi:hypothetical protein
MRCCLLAAVALVGTRLCKAGELHLRVVPAVSARIIEWNVQNALYGPTGIPVAFQLCFDYNCRSALPGAVPATANGTRAQTYDYVSTPENVYGGFFDVIDPVGTPRLSVWDFDETRTSFCRQTLYATSAPMPAACRLRGRSVATCSGNPRTCRHQGLTSDGSTAVAILTPEYLPTCSASGFAVVTESGNVPVCADEIEPNVYAFNGIHDSTAAVEYSDMFQVVYVDLKVHDTLEGAVFAVGLILALVIWTGATKGGTILSRNDLRPPTSMQKLLVADVSMSILATVCYSVHDHGLSLLPLELSYSIGDEYGSVVVSLYVLLQVVLTSIISALLMLPLNNNDYAELITLRALVEIQLLIAVHFHFPAEFGTMLRELVGLFISVTALVLCGRDSAILFAQKPLRQWHGLVVLAFTLTLHHVVVTGLYTVLLKSSHVSVLHTEVTAAALSAVIVAAGASVAV